MSSSPVHARGFSLIEVLVALSILSIATLVFAAMILRAVRAAGRARRETVARSLAAERLEQLRALDWGWGSADAPAPVTDTTTNLSGPHPTSDGTGLAPSPVDTLDRNVPGYVDYADNRGVWVGSDGVPPAAAVFARRWRISVVPALSDAVALQVRVGTLRPDGSLSSPFDDDAVNVASVKGRKAE